MLLLQRLSDVPSKRAKVERERYAAEKAVLDTVCKIIERIERSADREARAQEHERATGRRLKPWCCPAGSAPQTSRRRLQPRPTLT